MYLCSEGHDEVCYEVKVCPVCEVMEIVKEKDEEIANLECRTEDEISELQGENDSLQLEISSLKEKSE